MLSCDFENIFVVIADTFRNHDELHLSVRSVHRMKLAVLSRDVSVVETFQYLKLIQSMTISVQQARNILC